MNDIRKRLGKVRLYCDGGTGTLLQARGLKGGELPETWNLSRPDDILEIYKGYLEAGADIFNANTFGANGLKFPENLEEIVSAGVSLAKRARTETGREDACIALDIGPTGKLLKPLGDLGFEEAVALFGRTVRAGAAAGADLVLIETMNDTYETKAAVLAAKENCSLPILVTCVFDESGKLLTGGSVEAVVAMLEGLKVDALGVNCSLGPAQMLPIVRRITACASIPVIVNPNAGLPRTENGRTVYDVGPEDFVRVMEEIAALPVQVLGGCCGTTPEYISLLIEKTKDLPFQAPAEKNMTVVSSFSRACVIGPKPLIIGERINPTGKKRFKEALRENDIPYILQEGLRQEDAGAHILDVNVGLPEIDEPAMMEAVVTRLQSVTALPLQIDTSDPEALARALRLYNGKALINSVNGKAESIEAVMPVVARYGGVLVGLCLDEDGIPSTADGRFAIAQKIYAAAETYGIPKKDIVIDALAMTISSDQTSAGETLKTLRRVRDELGGHTILGVSNISFGLPAREIINAHFLSMAILEGLNLAILNPGNARIMQSYYASLALLNMDEQCMGYIEAAKDLAPSTAAAPAAPKAEAAPAAGDGLAGAIERGMKEKAAEFTRALLQSTPAQTIIDRELIPALDRVGAGFEKGSVFLPQLLMSADAAKAAFEVIKESMQGAGGKTHGTVILATVKGDIHDIGKNIVKVMLENYGYAVIDLGRDVPPEVIVQTAIDRDIRVVGLSALMTTTVVSMEETIRQLREKKPDTKVVVGGAVLTQEYADMIGADCYAKDAMATVRFCDRVFGS